MAIPYTTPSPSATLGNMAEKQHILVVEDEEHLAMGIKYNLVAEGFRVTVCGDGRAAVKLLTECLADIDLVVLDLMLPGMSGYAVCESLRAIDREMPVLILSARTLSEDRTRGFDLGANQYMTKPFDLDEFISRVRNLLTYSRRKEENRPPPPASHVTAFEFAGATINFDTFEVTVHGEAVRMTKMELMLLRYFIENQGRVIPRSELLENVWEMPGSIDTRAPDQFIRRLRKIFEPDPAQPRHFLTIRDAGYRFLPQGEAAAE
jgi:two-component system, OmpR family, alkaline phosphatase synthesis response regulator PhoP